jgi:hypothetical protein
VFADLDETIRQLLIRDVPLDLAEVDVNFDPPDREWSGRLSRPTINCFLYDVRENMELRQAEWDVRRDRAGGAATRSRPPLHIDAAYNVTAWARAPEDEHRLLWRVLMALARYAVLPSDVAAGTVADQPVPIRARVAQPDKTRTDPTDLWQVLDNRIRPALNYVLTVTLDPNVVVTSPLVFTRVARVGPLTDADGRMDELLQIGGRVRDRTAAAVAVSRARVVLKETGAEALTDTNGQFTFVRAPRGRVTFVVDAPGRTAVSIPAEVPSPTYDLEVRTERTFSRETGSGVTR